MMMFLFTELFGGHLFDTCKFILTHQNGNTVNTSIIMYYLYILFILGIVVKPTDSSPNELCKSENGFMSLLDESKILSRSKNEKGNTTIFLTPDQNNGLDETFTFICHKNENISDTKIIFESDVNYVRAQKNPAKRVLDFVDLTQNDFHTNTVPYSIKCEDVCEVIIIVIEFDATVLCDEKKPKRWNCGLDQLDEELEPYFPRSSAEDEENMTRVYEIQNPITG